MSDYQKLLDELRQQEEELQFTEFSSQTALTIGMMLVERARAENKTITIDIERNGHQLFHFAFDGTSPDNDEWIKGKVRVVRRFGNSSLFIGTNLKLMGKTIEDKYLISSYEYRAYGGAFPIRIRDTGVIGAVTVSGLAQEEDHAMVVEAIRKYLNADR